MLKRLNKIAKQILKKERSRDCVSLLLTNDDNIRIMNRIYRKIDKATDVLSFNMNEDGILGDIVISVDTAARNAKRFGVSLDNEMKRLVIHGTLHLLGHDHKNKSDKIAMNVKEDRYAKETD